MTHGFEGFLSAEDLAKLASGETAVAGDSLDTYAEVHQRVADVASQVPIASAFVPLVNAIWEPLTGKAGTSAEQKKRDAAAAQKKAADQARYVPPDVANARAAAKGIAQMAAKADADADAAEAKASTEADPNGPLHAAAKRARDYATLMHASMTQSIAKAAAAAGVDLSKTPAPPSVKHAAPAWRSLAIVGVVAAAGGALLIVLSRSRSRRSR